MNTPRPRAVTRAAFPTPQTTPRASSRSFQASQTRWLAERRGQEPDTVWGARAVAALAPWEEGDLCLSHAVALALEAAYAEGKNGQAPAMPDVRADLRPSARQEECEDCPQPVNKIARAAPPPDEHNRKGPRIARRAPRQATAPSQPDPYLAGITARTEERERPTPKPRPIARPIKRR